MDDGKPPRHLTLVEQPISHIISSLSGYSVRGAVSILGRRTLGLPPVLARHGSEERC